MSAWIFIIGLVLLWVGVSSRLARRERRSSELAALDYPIKVATFWGRDAKAERQALFDKFEEHKNWRINIRFQLASWTTFGIGATLCLVGAVLWLGKDETPTWDRLWGLVGPFVIAVVGIYYVYQLMKRLDKAESEVRWLSLMLDQVKDNGQVNYSELERRLERLEGRSNTNQGTQRLTQSTSVPAVAEPQ
jgi:Na+/melibiose symporter-like transporter